MITTTLIIVFSFTLGIKFIVLRKLLLLRKQYPENAAYYNPRIMVAKMMIIPTAVLLTATLFFKYWNIYHV